jgi:hypothetical protein
MTIAISLKVNDGVILAADSASTLFVLDSNGNPFIVNVYNSANKVFNLHKGLPIGMITWGAGNIGAASIGTLVKDLRVLLSAKDDGSSEWAIDVKHYSLSTIAGKVRKFMFEEKYSSMFAQVPADKRPILGFIVAGYSTGNNFPEEYFIQIQNGVCTEPILMRKEEETGVSWNGEVEAISRLILGFSPNLPSWWKSLTNIPENELGNVVRMMQQVLQAPLVQPAMPIQDAIDLANYLVQTAIQYSRFAPGAQTVGGPVEIAAITKHEGFKWIKRKHYFHRELNQDAFTPDHTQS